MKKSLHIFYLMAVYIELVFGIIWVLFHDVGCCLMFVAELFEELLRPV